MSRIRRLKEKKKIFFILVRKNYFSLLLMLSENSSPKKVGLEVLFTKIPRNIVERDPDEYQIKDENCGNLDM